MAKNIHANTVIHTGMGSTHTHEFDLPKSTRYKDWLIWPGTVLNFIDTVGCNDTIDGVCYKNKSVQECIDTCVNDCGAGYHIEYGNGKTVCVPIYTSIHPYLNPAYRLRKQSIYPELSNTKVTTFINTSKFPFPPNYANTIFYRDIITLQVPAVNQKVLTVDTSNSDQTIYTGTSQGNNLQIVQAEKSVEKFSYYKPVQYGDSIVIVIPGTSLVACVGFPDQVLEWRTAYTGIGLPSSVFSLIPVSTNQKVGDLVAFGDRFIIQHQNSSSLYIRQNRTYGYLEVVYQTMDDTLSDENCIFVAESKMTGWYCDNNQCKSIPIKNIEKHGTSGTYKGSMVDRTPSCWGCDKNIMMTLARTNHVNRDISVATNTAFMVISILTLCLIVSVLLFRKK